MPPSLPSMLRRSLRLHCVHCGRGRVFDGWTSRTFCPACGIAYERMDGYWLGAMIVNTAVTLAVFLAVLVGGMVVTWPDVPWTALTVATIIVNVVVPIVFHRWSRTIWMALEVRVHPLEPEESAAARQRVESDHVTGTDHLTDSRPPPP